ncbi:uncharacterized protein YukE [Streptomyces sp. LBL]|uniref:WXG100 family type VII secretion target n=1 Tax=Streptomyces sp. LBL TaxID=2940562 RepID=UPI00247662EA|nr:WXG100 family type VII secretion target [Streptomyces sp. LBL]MDH6630644.1 uncharacterized protein YukE [Streptomyces sp. LBL]
MGDKGKKNVDNGPVDLTGDYKDWDWKQIMQAVTGGAALDNAKDTETAAAISDPQSVQEAANAFYYTQKVLEDVAQSLKEQSEALAGDKGPWQGQAAQAFNTAMGSFSQQVTTMAEALSGGITGHHNIPQQLADNAQHLREGIAKINDINYWYAQQALKMNPHARMPNGLISVHDSPPIPEMMANDMRQVLYGLAEHYTVVKNAVVEPVPPDDPTAAPPAGSNPYSIGGPPYSEYPSYSKDLPQYSDIPFSEAPSPYSDIPSGEAPSPYGNIPSTSMAPPPYSNIPSSSTPYNETPYSNPQGSDIPTVSPYSGNLDGSSAGGLPPNAYKSVAPFPDSSLTSQPDTTPTTMLSGLDQTPSEYPGMASLGQSGGGLVTPGQLDPALDSAINPGTGNFSESPPTVMPFTGPVSGTGVPGSLANSPSQSRKANVSPYNGDLGLDAPGSGDASLPASGNSNLPSYSGASLPELDTAGVSAPDGSTIASYPGAGLGSSNGSGLGGLSGSGLGGLSGSGVSSYPGSGLSGLGSSAGSGLRGASGTGISSYPGTSVGGAGIPGLGGVGGSGIGPQTAAGMGGMPMMPMGGMGGMGAGGGSEGAPSDASGLLQGDAAPWSGLPSLDSAGDVVGGVGSGGPGLHLPQHGPAADGSPIEAAQAEGTPLEGVPVGQTPSGESGQASAGMGGMPMMPMGGMGGMGAGGGSEGAPSDASGLLQGDAAPWSGLPSLDSAGDVVGGVGSGGPGLHLPQHGPAADGSPIEGAASAEPNPAAVGMPMMPMSGMGAGSGTSERDHEPSDASGLLFGTAEPWASAPTGENSPGASHGAPRGEGQLRLPGEARPSAEHFSWRSDEQEPSAPQHTSPSAADGFVAGMMAGMPFVVAAAASATAGSGGSRQEPAGSGGNSEESSETAAPAVWGEPERATAEHSASRVSAGTAAEGFASSASAESAAASSVSAETAGEPARAGNHVPVTQVHGVSEATGPHVGEEIQRPSYEVEAPSGAEVSVPARQESAHHAQASATSVADDATTWDTSVGSLIPLLGPHGRGTSGDQDTGAEGARQDAAAATTVAAGAYAIAGAVAADRAGAEPARPAWRPKASGSVPADLTCSFADPDPEPESAARASERSAAADADGKLKEREKEEKPSVADLLRQGEEVWGGSQRGTGAFG